MPLTPYHFKFFANQVAKRTASDDQEKINRALSGAQVDLNPHQVEAAMFAFQSPLSDGVLLADEVGLGKTIEAGLVIAQYWAERKRRILIITPANLRKQWNLELLDKFYLPSLILESAIFKQIQSKGILNPFDSNEIVIVSYQFAATNSVFIRNMDWDLVVIDEAHRLRNVYKADGLRRDGMPKKDNIASRIKMATMGKKKILLTATPLQNSLLELYGLISIIDNHTFGDIKSFRQQYVNNREETDFEELRYRLEPLCHRTLRRQVTGYIKFTERTAILQPYEPLEDEQILYELVSDYLQRDNIYALPSSQRHLMTLVMRKLLASSTFAIGGTLQAFANRLKIQIADQEEKESVEEILTADFDDFKDFQEEWASKAQKIQASKDEDESDWEGESDDDVEETQEQKKQFSAAELESIKKEIAELEHFAQKAQNIVKNSKGENLLIALEKGFEAAQRLGAAEKAIIFTESRRTQDYLLRLLSEHGYEDNIVLFNGVNNDKASQQIYKNWLAQNMGSDRMTGSKTADMRTALVEHFRNTAKIMIATEAGGEGINLQFCSLLVNFDMPWNPQRIEQRIGRVHRYGQKYDVVVVNFLNTRNEADQRVYEILDEKFNLFSGVFGASDEVLGSITSGVDFEKKITEIYQNAKSADEIQSAFDALEEEIKEAKANRLAQTRRTLLENVDQEVMDKLKVTKEESQKALSKFERNLWLLAKSGLNDKATFQERAFHLPQQPFENQSVTLGTYHLLPAADAGMLFRYNHPLTEYLVEKGKNCTTPTAEITFQYQNREVEARLAAVEQYIGKSGWLMLSRLEIETFETEDFIFSVGITDDGQAIEPDILNDFFYLQAETKPIDTTLAPIEWLQGASELFQNQCLDNSQARNANAIKTETDKIQKWAADLEKSLEFELKETKEKINSLQREINKITNPVALLDKQTEIAKLETKKSNLRKNIYAMEDDIAERRNQLIKDIRLRIQQKSNIFGLFIIRWHLK
jgi:SNF2 family DNA or RNA helicase